MNAESHGVNESAPEARKSLAPAEGRGFRIVASPSPARGVRLPEPFLRPSGPMHPRLNFEGL
jgi:hypothetical protein